MKFLFLAKVVSFTFFGESGFFSMTQITDSAQRTAGRAPTTHHATHFQWRQKTCKLVQCQFHNIQVCVKSVQTKQSTVRLTTVTSRVEVGDRERVYSRVKRKAVHGFYVFSFGVRRGVRCSDVGSHKEDA